MIMLLNLQFFTAKSPGKIRAHWLVVSKAVKALAADGLLNDAEACRLNGLAPASGSACRDDAAPAADMVGAGAAQQRLLTREQTSAPAADHAGADSAPAAKGSRKKRKAQRSKVGTVRHTVCPRMLLPAHT